MTITDTPTPAAPGDSRPASRKKTLQKVGVGAAALAIAGGAALGVAANTHETQSTWEASQPGTHETIADGKLKLTLATNHGWYDVSDSTKPGTAVDPANFAVTPGDKLEKAQEISVELNGDNIRAELTANIKNLGGDLAAEGLSGNIRLVKGSYDPASGSQPEVITTTPIVDNPNAPQFTFTGAVTSTDGVYTVLTDLAFSSAAVLGEGASGVLQDTSFNLQQARPQAPKPWVIPDSYLRYAISQELGIPQENLTTADALKLTYLDLSPNGSYYSPALASLEGLQYATNLTGINLSWTKVSDVSPLSGATKLTQFTANHLENLTSIAPLAGLKLVYVTAEWTQIDSINALSAMGTVRDVDLLGDLALADISALAGKPNLNSVSVAYANQLTSLEALRFDAALAAVDARRTGVTDWSPVDHVASVFK
ncbi:hypothetical protein AB0284_20425 [Pseudarthrobacter phenanthrenivorans]|uniref:hypothetical protein n=1 Tax=Pseudarthrobacter phenanthrenivorans TaxID=361575 RepID=UPI00344F2ABF